LIANLLRAAALSAAALFLSTAHGQASQRPYPTRPIRLVVPYPAGGTTDFVARTLGERLSKALGQAVVVDNKAGASGSIGAGEVARAQADGYTLLVTITDSQVNNAALLKNLPYDPQRDFAPITQIVRSPALLSASTASGITSLADLQKRAAAGNLKMSYGSWGIGGLGHLAGESLNRSLKAGMVHVPQRGEAPVITDLLSGTIDVGWSSVPTALQHVQAGKIVPLAVLGRQRSTSLPQVPTLRELGFNDPIYETNVWVGLLAPAKTPKPILDRLADEVGTIAGSAEVTQLFAGRGLETMNSKPSEFRASFQPEFEIVTKRIRELGIEPQ
jgi:tripartite-type tricarboxylate transporter receptor subunit TctC